MPRPKRTRRAPTQHTAAAKSRAKSPSPDIDDDESDVPRQHASPERGRRRTTTRSMGSRANVAAETEKAIHAANQRRDAALDRLANEDVTTSGRTLDDAESGSSIEVGRRDLATPAAQRRDTTGLDLADDDVFGDLGDSFEDGEVPAGLRSADASSMTLSTFKRRSRQSSFVGRADPQIRPSSRGANTPSISSTLHFGNFRRRAREPSILGTARKPLRDGTGTGQEDNSESDEEEEEEFLPEAESTPLNNRRRTQPAPEVEDEREASPVAEEHVRPARSRKRKSEDANMSSDRPEKVSRVDHVPDEVEDSDEAGEPDEVVDDSDTSSLSSLSSPLGPPMVLPNRPVTPVYNEEDMAPPASSDSEENGDIWPDIHTLAKRRRRPSFTTPLRGGADNLSDMSSPPSLTHSPNYAPKAPAPRGRAAAAKRQPTPEITTADLTSMLPRRRYKPLGDRESGDDEHDDTEAPPHDEDEDELSYIDSRAAARRRPGSRPPLRATTSARPVSRGGRAAHSRPIPRSKPSAEGEGRTYSRQSSDKENEDHQGNEANDDDDENGNESRFEPLPDDTFDTGASQSGETTSADELKQASKKFKEVDRWELEYEEVTQSSSPSGAR